MLLVKCYECSQQCCDGPMSPPPPRIDIAPAGRLPSAQLKNTDNYKQ